MLSFLESVTHYNYLMAAALKRGQQNLAKRVLWSKQKFLQDQITNNDFYLFDHEYLMRCQKLFERYRIPHCTCLFRNRLSPPKTFLPRDLTEMFCPPDVDICPLLDPRDVFLQRPPPLENIQLFMRHSTTTVLWCNFRAFPIFFKLRQTVGFMNPDAIFFNPASELDFFGRAILSPRRVVSTIGHFNYGPHESFTGRLSTRFDGNFFTTTIGLNDHPLLSQQIDEITLLNAS